MEHNNKIALFQEKAIRKVWYEEQWYFSIIDVIVILSDTTNPTSYWSKVQKSIPTESEVVRFWHKLKLPGKDGKMYPTDCANTEGLFRIIMSVPSPKAEPFKMWLAEQGKRTVEELNDPELLMERQAEYYALKGYSQEWIANRMQTIKTRKELTNEWKNRGVKDGQEYSILTAVIAKGTFGLTPSDHAKVKGLEKENLRDHMTPMELILTAFSEEATRQIAIRDDSKGYNENHDAQLGSKIGGDARQNFEKNTGLKVVSSENFLNQIENTEKNKPLPLNDVTDITV
jgi:DNA-damage-inducible protein D